MASTRLGSIWTPILIDNEPQEFEFVLEKAALSHIGIQLGLPESLQHEFQVSLVFLRGPRKDEDVVQVDYAEVVDVSSQRPIDVGLERRR